MENAVLYGIGHGGIEVLTVLLPVMVLYLVIAILFSQGNVEEAMKQLKITEETAAAALLSIQAAASFGYGMMAANVVERLLAMLLHIGHQPSDNPGLPTLRRPGVLTMPGFYSLCRMRWA